jgi:hypothetical protein
MSIPGTIQYPVTLDDVISLIEAADNASSLLNANISVGDLLIPVTAPGKFAASGIATLTDSLTAPTKIEIFVYTSKSGANLVVPPGGRGAFGTTAQAFSAGNFVEQRPTARHHTALADAIRAIQAKLGIGADTPGATAEALFSNGAGASQWRAIQGVDVANVVRTDLASQQNMIGTLTVVNAALAVTRNTADAFIFLTNSLAAKTGFLTVDGSGVLAIGASGIGNSILIDLATALVSFPSIPTLPAASPTLANQAVRKQYVDDKGTYFSISWFIPDPSAFPTNSQADLPFWRCPPVASAALTRMHIIFTSGSHTPGSAVSFGLLVSGVTQASLAFSDTNNTAFLFYTVDFADVPIADSNGVMVTVNGKSGTITERSVTVIVEGYQKLKTVP